MWTGWIVFAAALLILAGLLHLAVGFISLFDDGYFAVAGSDGAPVWVDYTWWGVVHLLVGALALLIGIGLMAGNMVARGAAVVLVGFSAVANLAFMASAPAWSLLLVGVDLAVLYAVIVHGDELGSDA